MTALPADAVADVAAEVASPLRVHWVIPGDRNLCGRRYVKTTPSKTQLKKTPFCGACVFVIHGLGFRTERLPWEGYCAPPDVRPSEAMALLRKTHWESVWFLDHIDGEDLWPWESSGSWPHGTRTR